MAIQFGGLSTGLDTTRMISQLVRLERQPIGRLQSRRRAINTEITNIGMLSSEMSELTDMLDEITEEGGVMSYSATSSKEEAVTAAATGQAQPGTFELQVDQLARAARVRSQAFGSDLDVFGEGTLRVEVFEEDAVEITVEAGDTLRDVRDRINAATSLVSASIMDTGSGAYLSIASNKQGHTIGGAAADALVLDHQPSAGAARTFQTVKEASNARFELDGLAIEQHSNTVDSVLEGVSLQLEQTTTGPVELNVSPDSEGMIERVEAFVEQYNAVVDAARAGEDGRTESRERALEDMREVLISTLGAGGGEVTNLSSAGVEASRSTGKLSVDRGRLEEVLAREPEAVSGLFGGASGIAERLTASLERYTEGSDGFLNLAREGLRARVDTLEGQIERKERSVDRYERRLQRQFTQLEMISVELQDIQSRFASFIPMLQML